ncbi:MAG TPA: glycosyltransferase family 39 protein, partial [Candidatus Bathyarchaeia archaeon]|nr:glycosyltransferase family 39 protein [Candidatus Bathyarchaeia archaeon]
MPLKTKTKSKLASKKKSPVKKVSVEKKPAPRKDISLKMYIILGALIVLGALFIRSYHLSTLPPGVYPDEAVNGIDAITANAAHHWKLFYENNNGREGLFMNLIAMSFSLFGVSIITLKMWSVLFGTLTVLGMILLGEELFASRRAGLIAGFITATTFWAINFSRISFRAIMLPFVLVFTVFFLIRGIQKKKIIDYILAGLFFGLGVHTYIAFRIAPLILVVLLIAFMVNRKRFLTTHWKEILAFIVAMTLVALPMLADFYVHRDHFSGRTSQVSVFNPEINQGHLLLALGKTFGLSLGQYSFFGDQNWRHNLPPWPELFPTIGIFFLAGFFYFIYEFFWLVWRRIRAGERSERLILVALLLSWFFAMLLPEAISAEGLPHALRSIGAMPVAILLAVFSIEGLWKWAESGKLKQHKKTIQKILVVLVIASGIWSVKLYFVDWAENPNVPGAFGEGYFNMSRYINSLPSGTPKYVVDNGPGQQMEDGLQTSAEVVKLFTYQKAANVQFVEPDFDPAALKTPSKIFLMRYDDGLVNHIRQSFPNSLVKKMDTQEGRDTDFTMID